MPPSAISLVALLLRAALAPYLHHLRPVIEGESDVIGMVVAVNGKVISADVFASRELFRKLWPRLLEGAALEAFLESDAQAGGAVREQDVRLGTSDRDPDAGGEPMLLVFEVKRQLDRLLETAAQGDRRLLVDVLAHHDELIPAEPGDGVCRADSAS